MRRVSYVLIDGESMPSDKDKAKIRRNLVALAAAAMAAPIALYAAPSSAEQSSSSAPSATRQDQAVSARKNRKLDPQTKLKVLKQRNDRAFPQRRAIVWERRQQ